MRVSKILIKGFQQFENFQLDLTHPETGEPLEKVCLIGPNGTGKSTILGLILRMLQNLQYRDDLSILPRQLMQLAHSGLHPGSSLVVKFVSNQEQFILQVLSERTQEWFLCYDKEIETVSDWQQSWQDYSVTSNNDFYADHQLSELPVNKLISPDDIVVYEPSDESLKLNNDPPSSTLNEALDLFSHFPLIHTISVASANEFWKLLTFLVKKRESDYLTFINQPENQNTTIGNLKEEFDPHHPEILQAIAVLWDGILAKCGLYLDVQGAKIPVQLTENLRAYIKSKNTGEQLSYNQLSSGIRNYIFKLGYIKSLYFNRQIKRGFLLIDEPENCLYPDLLYDLMDDYWSIIENTQTFVSTHSPIIAAQFEPYERFHLDFDDRGYVTATRGVSPIGDDPNDLLYRDFQVRSIYGKKGLEKWERFRELRQLIRATDDPAAKEALMSEYTEIANAYNFPVPR
jgi:energy-coupling factor transporter ATP-binding protein EcfA2